MSKEEKKETGKLWAQTGNFFVSDDQIQKKIDPKGLQIKMSSVLNISNANSKPEEFSLNDIEMLVDSEEQNWFKRAHVGKSLGLKNIRTSLNDLDKCEILTKQELIPTDVARRLGLDPKINKATQINSSHSLGLFMSL